MLIDEAQITVISGAGGEGVIAFYPGHGKPCGGDGGRGGTVSARVDAQLTSLLPYLERKERRAEAGGKGSSFNCQGRDADELILLFPQGTVLTDLDTGEVIELQISDSPTLLCKGGNGGYGNTTINLKRNHLFEVANPGRPGQTRRLSVVMRLIADCGLIGFPNAGKSSLLNVVTRAHARVADYPFTTLEPNLGVLYAAGGYRRVVIADIPGLIEGASQGKGLGIKFLKHVEKVNLLLHCISCESVDIAGDYEKVRDELGKYNPELLKKAELILITKCDLIADDPDRLKKIGMVMKSLRKPYLLSSIIDDASLRGLAQQIAERV